MLVLSAGVARMCGSQVGIEIVGPEGVLGARFESASCLVGALWKVPLRKMRDFSYEVEESKAWEEERVSQNLSEITVRYR